MDESYVGRYSAMGAIFGVWRARTGDHVETTLQSAVESRGLPHNIIGDCVAPRQVHIAIAEGAMAARSI